MKRFSILLCVALSVGTPAMAQTASILSGPQAFGDWQSDRPGLQRKIRPDDLPAPYASHSASNGPGWAPFSGAPNLRVPPGFAVTLWAKGFEGPRTMKVAPNGDVFIAETGSGTIKVIRPDPKTGEAGMPKVFASGLEGPFGMAFPPSGDHPRWLYVATVDRVQRFAYSEAGMAAAGPAEPVADLDISDGGHSTRDLVFSRDGSRFFVSVGSQSNVAEDMSRKAVSALAAVLPKGAAWDDETRRADVLVFDADGTRRRIYATGIRNCVGLALPPGGDEPYCATNERDGLGDDLPPDYVTRVKEGGFYGWPWFYIGNHQDPRHEGERPDLAGEVVVPDVLIQPHSAPLAITFYDVKPEAASAFPAAYAGSAFVALHGSWNRARRTGYKVVRIPMEKGVPTGAYEDFLTGFVNRKGDVLGRPVGVAVSRDGALLVSEDENGTIWRIAPTP